jgi:hypothetical protein
MAAPHELVESVEAERREVLELEQLARAMRCGTPIDLKTMRFKQRLADGLRVTGALRRYVVDGKRPGPDVPIAVRARAGQLVEELRLRRTLWTRPADFERHKTP